MMKKFALFLCTVFLLASCTLTGDMTISSTEFEGSADFKVETSAYCMDLLEDLSAWSFTDEDMVDKALNSAETFLLGLDPVLDVKTEHSGKLSEISFDFDSLKEFAKSFTSDEKSRLLSVETVGSQTRMNLFIDSDSFKTVEDILPFSEQNGFAIFSSKYNENMEEDEYLEMLEFIFSEDISSEIADSLVKLVITLPSDIISTNGEQVSSNVVSFSLPLIKLMLIKQPLDFEVVF